MTNEQHNKYVGYSFLGYAGLMSAFWAIILFALVLALASPQPPDAPPPVFFVALLGFAAIMYSIVVLPAAIAGYAVLKRKKWARMASIIGAVVSGAQFPWGTVACVYALWFFFSDNWKEVYETGELPFNFEQHQIAYGVESQRAAYQAEANEKVPFRPYEPPDWR